MEKYTITHIAHTSHRPVTPQEVETQGMLENLFVTNYTINSDHVLKSEFI